ncbi:site-specific DNA-methyltransferase [Candidatus Pacearchaeota archaeon]|nr:site-specific DNA-methyltransferase [Candidatus Pacearchaeota archaeon]
MKEISDESIDMILQDPPYNSTACKWEWDIMIRIDEFWSEWTRIIKPHGAIVMTASQPFTSKLVMSNIKMFKYEWIWHKSKPTGIATVKYRPMKSHENILVFCRTNTKYNPIKEKRSESSQKRLKQGKYETCNTSNSLHNGLGKTLKKQVTELRFPTTVKFFASKANNKENFHPTQKPVTLFEYLIKTYTNEKDVVFDGFAGSGTTAIAAINTNRNYICCELDEEYVKIANNRIGNIEPSLFAK